MKTFFIFLTLTFIIMIQFDCNIFFNEEVPLWIWGVEDFGDVKVNEASDFERITIDAWQGVDDNEYIGTGLIISISDKNNFTLDTSMTDKYIERNYNTYFKVRFNPKSTGSFSATVTIKTDRNTYSHDIHGRGI